jgi:cell division transport system permease protein
MRFKMLSAEAWRSITSNISTTFAAVVTVLIGMFLIGLLVAFGTYAESWTAQQKKKLVVKVYFCTDQTCPQHSYATKEEIDKVGTTLQANPYVKSVTFVSKEEALRQMKIKHPEIVAGLPSNPLPDALEVKATKGENTAKIAQSLNPRPPGVQLVRYGAKTTRKVLKFAHFIEILFAIAGVILLGASTLLIGNTIRLSIFARRREIEVMKLVGASNWFVRGPFMLEGVITGLMGSLAAIILLLVGKEIALPSILPHLGTEPGVKALAFPLTALILLGLGLLLGAAGSGLTLRRFLRI